MLATALLLAAASTSQGGAFGWRCTAAMEIDGYRGSMWREYPSPGSQGIYLIQLRAEGDKRHDVTWTIDSRPEGPPASQKWRFLGGRREADAFATGPDYVHIDFAWHTEVIGPVWAHYWGNGRYVGAEMLMTARNVRRFTGRDAKMGGISGGLSNRFLLTALAPTPNWSVVATDATGKQLFVERFTIPRRDAVEAAYRTARFKMDALEAVFRVDHEDRRYGDLSCADNGDPAGDI